MPAVVEAKVRYMHSDSGAGSHPPDQDSVGFPREEHGQHRGRHSTLPTLDDRRDEGTRVLLVRNRFLLQPPEYLGKLQCLV